MSTILATINSKYIHTNLAIRYLKANAPTFDITLREYTLKDTMENMVNDLLSRNPKIIGFSVYIWNVEKTLQLINLLKEKDPTLTIIIGGPEVSYDFDVWFKRSPIDYIIYGEGELSFKELMEALHGTKEISEVRGIVYRNLVTNELVQNPAAPILDPKTILSPFYFEEDIPHLPNRIQYIETSRGCPYSCQYCLASVDNKVRYFDLDKVKDEIRYLMKHGAKTFKFLDRTFNINKKYALEMFDFIIEEHLPGTQFQFEITADIMPTELIDYLNEHAPAELFRFEIGIQSTYELTNQLVKRRQNFEKLTTNILRIKEGGKIILHLDLIAGLPEEPYDRFEQSFNDVFDLRPEELQLGFLKMLRGTGLRKQAEQFGYEYDEFTPYQMKKNNTLSESDVHNIHLAEEILERYWNAHRLDYTMKYLVDGPFKSSPFAFMQQFGAYWEGRYSWIKYQLTDLFTRLYDYLEVTSFEDLQTVLSYMKLDYLTQSKIKPKIWWEDRLDKQDRRQIVTHLAQHSEQMTSLLNQYKLNLNDIFKYAMIEPVYLTEDLLKTPKLHYLIVIYLPNKPTQFHIIEAID